LARQRRCALTLAGDAAASLERVTLARESRGRARVQSDVLSRIMLPAARFVCSSVIVIVLACVGPGCSSASAPSPPADELSFAVFPTTTILTDAELSTLTSAKDGTLTFGVAPPSLADIEVGHVLVAPASTSTPKGLLRVVIAIRRDGNTLALSTMQAPIALAFRKLHVKSERDVTGIGAAAWDKKDVGTRSLTPRPKPGLKTQGELLGGNIDAELPLDFLLYDADSDPQTTDDQIGIKGSLGGGFHFGISVDVDWGDVFDLPNAVKTCVKSLAGTLIGKLPDCSITALLPEVKVAFEADPFMKAHASLYGAASFSYEKDFDLASIVLEPIPIGPLVFVPNVDITAKVAGSAGAGFTVGAHGVIELQSSVAISSKHPASPDIVPIAVKRAEFAADDTKVILQATAKVGVGARLSVELYGVVGPYLQATAFAEVKADAFAKPCWSLHIGVDTVLGVRVTSPEIPFLGSITLLDWKGLELTPVDEVISSGACLPVEKGPPLPPGSGPDAVTYANPTFAPWAHVSSPVGGDGAVKSFLDDGAEWTDTAPAIDGRYVSVGSRNDAVVKMDESGAVVWSRRYRREKISVPFVLRRIVPTHDAAMMILTEAQDGEPASLLKIGQAGGVYFRKRIELAPEAKCDFEPFGLLRDKDKGFFVLAACLGDERAALAHLDENADVLDVQLFGDPNPQERSIVASTMAQVGSDVVVMGGTSTTVDGARMFAIRLPGDGGSASAVWANRVVGCNEVPDLHPSQARINAQSQLTIVGTAGDHRDGLVMRMKDDGSVAFANFARFDATGDRPFNVHAFAELPTTGLLVAGMTDDLGLPSGTPGTESSIFVASLDSTGRALWANRYTLPNGRSLNQASIRLTDDGGVLVMGKAERTTADPHAGGLYAMKAFAKNGDLAGAPGVTVTPMSLAAPLVCPVNVVPWPAVVTRTTAVVTDVPTVVEDGAVQPE
jgi:hypothetical protein